MISQPARCLVSLARLRPWTFDVTGDSYVVVRVDGERPLSPVVGDRKTFTAYPFALTNPIFIDVDGDGRYRTGAKHGH